MKTIFFTFPAFEEKICYDHYNDEYDIFSPPTIEKKINYDYNMSPISYDYGDENSNGSYFF
jgi:hypothetical protein